MSLQQIINYDNASNFTYDATLAEFSGSVVRLLDQRLTDSKAYASYTSDQNDLWYSVSGTLAGGASVSSGVLNCDSGGNDACDYPSSTLYTTDGIFCIRFKLTPQYTGNPAADRPIFSVCKNGSSVNRLFLQHDTSGDLQLMVRENGGAYVYNNDTLFGAYSPSTGVAETWEFNLDLVNGQTRLFIDGVQKGNTGAGTSTDFQASVCDVVRLGNDQAKSLVPDFKFDDFVFFSTVQHTSNHADELPYSYSETIYPTSNPTVLNNSGVLTDALDAFVAVVTAAGSDAVKFVINADSVDKYWTGTAWANSSGYAQSNTAAEINTNAASLDISSGVTLKVKAYLHSNDGSTRPSATSATVDYDFYHTPTTANKCKVYGTLTDPSGTALAGEEVKAVPTTEFFYDEILVFKTETATSDSQGRYELSLTENASYGGDYTITIPYTDGTDSKTKTFNNVFIPNETTKKLSDIAS